VAPAEVLPRARAALAEALERDEALAEAHAANAYIRAYYDWDWRGAEREFRRAIELRPSYADAYFSYSRFLASRRRLDEAIAQLGRAIELDPLSLPVQANLALLYYFAGRYDEAETRLRAVLRNDSTDVTAVWGLALVAEQEGRPRDAIALLQPISAASNSPSGFNARRICANVPGRSLTNCNASADTARSSDSGASASGSDSSSGNAMRVT